MRNRLSDSVIAGVAVAALLLAATHIAAQAPAYRAPRAPDGKPNLNGIWQALNTADWDLQGHAAAKGPVASLGAVFAVPPGLSVVEGNEIPYLPAAAAQKKQNQANWTALDPEAKCYLGLALLAVAGVLRGCRGVVLAGWAGLCAIHWIHVPDTDTSCPTK